MSSIIDRIKSGTKNSAILKWPGTENEVTLRILSKDELQEATFAAHKRFMEMKVPPGEVHTIETFKDEETVQILYRSLRGVGNEADKFLAPNVNAFRVAVTSEELSALAEQYDVFQKETSPTLESMSNDAFDAFLADLKKKPEVIISCVSDIAFARRLLRSLVKAPEN